MLQKDDEVPVWGNAAPGENVTVTLDKATASAVTGAGYFFARRIRKELGQPVGLVNATWGGSEIEAWPSAEALDKDPAL